MNTAYNMDCMEAMKAMPDKCFDLAVVDPPYGIGAGDYTRGGKQYGKAKVASVDYGRKKWDDSAPSKDYFRELLRVSKNQIIFGANHFADRLPNPSSSCWIVWDKENGDNCYADCELAYTSFPSAIRIFRFRWQGMLQGDMANKEIRIHPTQKPVALYRWIFQHYARPGDKILDTHMGSGSSRIAAYEAGLDFMGFEIDPDYFAGALERYEAAEAQMSMFVQAAGTPPPFEEIARAWEVTRGGSLRERVRRRREKADRRGPWPALSYEPFHTYTLFNMRVRAYFFRLGKGGI